MIQIQSLDDPMQTEYGKVSNHFNIDIFQKDLDLNGLSEDLVFDRVH